MGAHLAMLFSSNWYSSGSWAERSRIVLVPLPIRILPRKNKLRLQWVCLLQQQGAVAVADCNGETAQAAFGVHIGDAIGRHITGEDQLYRHGGVRGHDGGQAALIPVQLHRGGREDHGAGLRKVFRE